MSENVITTKCVDCQVVVRFEEKSVDENRSIYGAPEYCPYCGKRSLE